MQNCACCRKVGPVQKCERCLYHCCEPCMPIGAKFCYVCQTHNRNPPHPKVLSTCCQRTLSTVELEEAFERLRLEFLELERRLHDFEELGNLERHIHAISFLEMAESAKLYGLS